MSCNLSIILLVCIAPLLAACGMTCYTCEAFDPAIKAEHDAERAAANDAACQSYGAKPGTQEYFQCRLTKDQQRQQAAAALAGAILSRPQPQPYVLPMPAGR